MPKSAPLEDFLYPPFAGFPRSGLAFLHRLKKNNNRPWFQARKAEYQENVRFPMECLIAGLAARLHDDVPEVEFNPRKSIFRIYRDTRFSKNKTPYKTNVAAWFGLRSMKGNTESPGLYVGVGTDEVWIGGGLYMPTGEQLKAIRRSIADSPDEYLAVVRSPRFRKKLGGIQGEMLSRAPLGYRPDHPMIEHLRHKQFFAGVELDERACTAPRFLETVAVVFTDTMPLVRWLARAVS
ncbi:MAG TPA: DUF2461 domain-containing protein [Bacteroidota bacterium]|nr:DUF2461 domain-containing protein [Bacteroidota bacterium]